MEIEILYDRRSRIEGLLHHLDDDYAQVASLDCLSALHRLNRLRRERERLAGEIQDIEAMIFAHE